MIISAPEAEMSTSMSAVHTCIRGEVRSHEFDLPRSAVSYQNYHTASEPLAPEPPPVVDAGQQPKLTNQPERRGGTTGVAIDTPDGRFSITMPGLDGGASTDRREASRSATVAPEPRLPSEVEIVIRNPNNDWTDVRINGETVAEFRNQREMTVKVRPGTHFIEFVPFMKDTPFASGRLVTGEADHIIFGLSHSDGVTCFNHDGWQPR